MMKRVVYLLHSMEDSLKDRETQERIYNRYGWNCFVCGKRANQLAHIVGNTLLMRRLYGKRIIDSEFNVLPVCGLKHNKLIDVGRDASKAKGIIKIIDDLEENKAERIGNKVREWLK